LLIKTIEQIVAGTAQRKPQDTAIVTFAPLLKKETGKIDWNNKVSGIVNLIRGLSPTPAAYTTLDGLPLKIFKAEAQPENVNQPPGTIGEASPAGMPVAASDGYVILKDVQLAGKKRMLAQDFLRGYRLNPGTVLQ